MVLAALIVFITPINNQLLWFFTSLHATEVTASTLHLQLSPSSAYVLITICILSFQPRKSMSTLLTPSCNATICKVQWFLDIDIPHMLQIRKIEADIRRSD